MWADLSRALLKTGASKTEILGQIPAARGREARERKAGRRAVSAYYDRQTGRVMMELTSGFVFGFPAKSIPLRRERTVRRAGGLRRPVGDDPRAPHSNA